MPKPKLSNILQAVKVGVEILKTIDFNNVGKRGKRLTALEEVVEKQNEQIKLLSEAVEAMNQNIND